MKYRKQIAVASALGVIFASGSVFAHHAFGSLFDAGKVHRLKGVVIAVAWTNPHSLVFIDTKDSNGQVEHWAIEGRPSNQWQIMGVDRTTLKAGDTIEVCGYATKDGLPASRSYTPPEPISLSLKSIPRETSTGRLIFPEVLTLPNGRKFTWGVGGSCMDAAR